MTGKKKGLDEARWASPEEITDVELAFPAHALDWMPEREDIPPEFNNYRGESPWCALADDWFGNRLVDPSFYPQPGVDAESAYRMLSAILHSFAPKHEHKTEAVAYLASRWFVAVICGEAIYAEDPDAVRNALSERSDA